MIVKPLVSALVISVLATSAPAFAATSLSSKDRARVARAPAGERDDVRYCLIERSKGRKKGTIIGAAGGAAVGVVAGGNLGESALAAGVGALAGRALGAGNSGGRTCDDVLKRNP